jgi:hypothetical protein
MSLTVARSAQAAWGLTSIGFGLNEISSAITIGKFIGSQFTHGQEAQLFDVLESSFGVRVRPLPVWLEDVQLGRRNTVLGQCMRRIEDVPVLDGLHTGQLKGLANFIVLCLRYADLSKSDMVSIMESILRGELGNIVVPGSLGQEALPYSMKSLLRRFVEACLDADADTRQARDAKQSMADLLIIIGGDWLKGRNTARDWAAIITVLSALLGSVNHGRGVDASRMEAAGRYRQSSEPRPHVHNTLNISAAYVALAAAANGADVAVECISSRGTTHLPLKPHEYQPTALSFVVRLWIKQPPEHILPLFNIPLTSDGEVNVGGSFVVFGGAREVSTALAKALKYEPQNLQQSSYEGLASRLWDEGRKISDRCAWETSRSSLGLRLQPGDNLSSPKMGLSAPEIEL